MSTVVEGNGERNVDLSVKFTLFSTNQNKSNVIIANYVFPTIYICRRTALAMRILGRELVSQHAPVKDTSRGEQCDGVPLGSYAKYKQATEFFLDWLLLARGRGKRVAGASARLKLDAFQEVVDQIAREPSAFLTPRVLSQLLRALEACQSSITLREHVSQFFVTIPGTASSAEMQRHQHFLSRLMIWYTQLNSMEDQAALEDDAGARGNVRKSSGRFANYYEVLFVEADYFDQEDMMRDFIAAALAPLEDQKWIVMSRKVDRISIFNEAFAQDLL